MKASSKECSLQDFDFSFMMMSNAVKKLSSGTEIDLDEINENILKNIEDEMVTLRRQVKLKDRTMEKLLERVRSELSAEKDAELKKLREKHDLKIYYYETIIEGLNTKLKRTEQKCCQKDSTIEHLEAEVKRIKTDKSQLQADIDTLYNRINVFEENSASSSVLDINESNSPLTDVTNKLCISQKDKSRKNKSKNDSLFGMPNGYLGGDFEDKHFLKASNIIHHSVEALSMKLEFLDEKLINEQNKNRELEIIIENQKNIIDENMIYLKVEKGQLEGQIKRLQKELDMLNTSLGIKNRVDSVIAFCEIMENCAITSTVSVELFEKLAELPIIISSYLRGHSETLRFNKNLHSDSRLVAAVKDLRAQTEEEDYEYKRSDQSLSMHDLDDLKQGISSLTEILSKTLPRSNGATPRKLGQDRNFLTSLTADNSILEQSPKVIPSPINRDGNGRSFSMAKNFKHSKSMLLSYPSLDTTFSEKK